MYDEIGFYRDWFGTVTSGAIYILLMPDVKRNSINVANESLAPGMAGALLACIQIYI